MDSFSPADLKQIRKRRNVIVAIQLLLALGFIIRPANYLSREGYIFYHSYYADVMIPFGFYFLLSVNEQLMTFLRNWKIRAAVVFTGATITEVLQYFGIYALGVTFDPLDILAFAIGTIMAVLVDRLLFPIIFSFWEIKK